MERAAPVSGPPASPRTVVVTGASGFIGLHLLPALVARGGSVRALTRGVLPEAGDGVRWSAYEPTDAASYGDALDGADAVVHLAGESIVGGRWTAAKRERIRSSRVETTRALVAALTSAAPGASKRPTVLVSTSAIGWYGPRPPDEALDEAAAPGSDFLAGVCRAWEDEAAVAEKAGVRVVRMRVGIVLGRGGGSLAKMLMPFRMFVGGPIGDGRQAMSWIHVDDLTSMFATAVEDDRWSGPINATAPAAATNREFSKALGRALHRPAFVRTPRWALRLALGKVTEVLATGQRVLPAAALARGFAFRHPALDEALADVLRT